MWAKKQLKMYLKGLFLYCTPKACLSKINLVFINWKVLIPIFCHKMWIITIWKYATMTRMLPTGVCTARGQMPWGTLYWCHCIAGRTAPYQSVSEIKTKSSQISLMCITMICFWKQEQNVVLMDWSLMPLIFQLDKCPGMWLTLSRAEYIPLYHL